jgi:hypothetical protein
MTGTRDALLIATTRYSDDGLGALRAPFADASDLEHVLADPLLGDFRVLKLVDQPSMVVRRQLESFFRDRATTDLLVVYLSGHGLKDDDGNLHFAMTDTDRELLLSTAVPAGLLSELMNRCRARQQVMLLDCCYSGAFARSLVSKGDARVGVGDTLAGRGRVVLTASDALQYSFEGEPIGDEAPRSVFTQAIVDGMRSGAADLDHDGTITPDELFDYACDRLRADGRSQTPRKWALDVGGDIVLSRTGTQQTSPAPVFARKSGAAPTAPPRPRWLVPAAAIGAVLLVAIVLVLAGAFGGDDPEQLDQSTATTATVAAPTTAAVTTTAAVATTAAPVATVPTTVAAPAATSPPPAPPPSVRIVGPTAVQRNVQACWTVEWANVVGGTWSLPGFNMANPGWSPGDGFCATVQQSGNYTLTLTANAADGRVVSNSLTFTS